MKQLPWYRRWLLPALIAIGVWGVADGLLGVVLAQPQSFCDLSFYRATMNSLIWLRAGVILFGSLLLYPATYARGATLPERVSACVLNPLAFGLRSMVRATDFFPTPQAVYYGFNSIVIGSLFLQLTLMATADSVCRWRAARPHGSLVRQVTWLHLVAISVGLLGVYVTYVWGHGVYWFYLYQEGYRWLFL